MAAVPQRRRLLLLGLGSCLFSGQADWLATHTADQESAEALQSKLREKFGKRIDGIHTSPLQSYYWADGDVREQQEVRTLLDSDVPFLELRSFVEAEHPYTVPMIISAAHGGNIIAKRDALERYLMGTVDINQTTAAEVKLIGAELVQIRYVACSHVEPAEDKKDTHRLTIKTTSKSRTHIMREFGGLEFEWTPVQGNRPFIQWLEQAVQTSSEL